MTIYQLGIAIFIADKLDFIDKSIKLSKEDYVTMLKGIIHNKYVK